MIGRHRAGRALLASAVAVSGMLAIGARPAAAFPGPTVDLVGHGFGHGRGLGQFGSLGYALKGWNYHQILDHYYGGTKMGTLPDGDITVQLTKFDGLDVIVTQEHGHLHTSAAPGSFKALLARKTGTNRYTVYVADDCGGGPVGWQELRANVPGPVTFSPDNPRTEDRTEMLQVCELGGVHRWVRGEILALEGKDAAGTTSRAVNKVALEGYVKGVVPRESPASWGTAGGGIGMHALRAQAVAARSYASAERRSDWAQTCDTQSCQVYGGRASQDGAGNFTELEAATSNQAVDDTRGEVRLLLSDLSVARTEFSSSTGGYTAGGQFPAVPDEGDSVDSNPSATWTAKIPVALLESSYPQIGTLQSVDVTKRNGLGDWGGRVVEVVLRGSKGKATLSGADLRGLWSYSSASRPDGLRSDWFRVVNNPSGGLSGYWVVAPDGGIFSFGDAAFFGSTGGLKLNSPILGLAATKAGQGYWLVAADGGIFSFGDAQFYGSTGGIKLNKPVVGMAPTPSGNGYWLLAADGGLFGFGDATFFGSLPGSGINGPAVAMRPTRTGGGYLIVTAAGAVVSYGDAPVLGSVSDAVPGYKGGVAGLDVKAAPAPSSSSQATR